MKAMPITRNSHNLKTKMKHHLKPLNSGASKMIICWLKTTQSSVKWAKNSALATSLNFWQKNRRVIAMIVTSCSGWNIRVRVRRVHSPSRYIGSRPRSIIIARSSLHLKSWWVMRPWTIYTNSSAIWAKCRLSWKLSIVVETIQSYLHIKLN